MKICQESIIWQNDLSRKRILAELKIYLFDANCDESYDNLKHNVEKDGHKLHGIFHSIAFANYQKGKQPIYKVDWNDFKEATKISCFSLPKLAGALENSLNENGSIVTMSISNTRATNYGYMGPIKACLDSTVAFLAKDLSTKGIRCNSICAGPLKTSASAGIPGYVDNYLFAEKLTLKKEALKTSEVANSCLFLLSPASSGLNATGLVVDGGMSCNYFDEEVVSATMNS